MGTRIFFSRWRQSVLLWFGLFVCTVTARAEVILYSTDELVLNRKIEVRLPDHAVRDQDYEKGFLSVYFLVNQAWTVNGRDENAIRLADSQAEYLTVTAPKWDDYGCLSGNRVFQLDFPLPAQRNPADPLRLVIPGGIRNWSQNAPTAVEIWTGPRLDGHSFVDKMNRNCIIALNDLGDEVETYHYEFPGRTLVSESPTARRRLNGSRPFSVTCRAKLTDGGWLEKTVAVTPHEKTTAVPLPDDEILVGLCVYRYSEDKRENANPPSFVTYKHQPEKEIELLIEEAGTNLIVPWFNPPVASVAAAAEKGIHMMTIYQTCAPEKNLEYTEAGKNYFWLNNNIGEYASYLYQDEHCLPQGVNQSGDLAVCCDFFINDYIRRGVERYHDVYPYIFSTSGSTLANYELAGGVDFMLCELYALGAQNLAWSSAEMRGAARKWQPEFWGGWLAAEWQSCNVPYLAPQKYHMLRVGLYLQYLMGSRIIILESGSQSTQAGEYTQPLDPKAAYPHRDYNSDDEPVKNYKKEMTDFYDFVKSNPRSGGTPETRMASVLGNCGSFVGLYIDWFAAFSQHAQAKQNPNWLYGDPERTDVAVQQTMFPVPPDALGEYRNSWIGGSPYGQCDVVNIDSETRPADIERYSFLFYGGWNSMTPEIMEILRSYVENGGTLFIGMPHFSTRLDREYRNYTVEDLVNGGDLSALCDFKVVGRKLDGGVLRSDEMAIDGVLEQEPMAEIVAGENVETVIAAGERPFLVREKIGDGEIYVLLTWEYAGKESLASSYKQILAALADRRAGDIRVREAERGDNAPQYIAYAVWPEAIYLLNTDCMRERTFIFDDRGRTETITLQPMEFRAIQR